MKIFLWHISELLFASSGRKMFQKTEKKNNGENFFKILGGRTYEQIERGREVV